MKRGFNWYILYQPTTIAIEVYQCCSECVIVFEEINNENTKRLTTLRNFILEEVDNQLINNHQK